MYQLFHRLIFKAALTDLYFSFGTKVQKKKVFFKNIVVNIFPMTEHKVPVAAGFEEKCEKIKTKRKRKTTVQTSISRSSSFNINVTFTDISDMLGQ